MRDILNPSFNRPLSHWLPHSENAERHLSNTAEVFSITGQDLNCLNAKMSHAADGHLHDVWSEPRNLQIPLKIWPHEGSRAISMSVL